MFEPNVKETTGETCDWLCGKTDAQLTHCSLLFSIQEAQQSVPIVIDYGEKRILGDHRKFDPTIKQTVTFESCVFEDNFFGVPESKTSVLDFDNLGSLIVAGNNAGWFCGPRSGPDAADPAKLGRGSCGNG